MARPKPRRIRNAKEYWAARRTIHYWKHTNVVNDNPQGPNKRKRWWQRRRKRK